MGDLFDDPERTRVSEVDKLRAELARRTQRDRAYVIVLAGSEVGKMFKLDQGETVIGRSRRADVRLDDDSISRMHVKLHLNGTNVELEDLGSSNGTLVNGDRVSRQPLKDGDKIRLGDTTILKFSFHDRLDESFQRKMYEAALRDPLTKAYNKRYFLDQLNTEIAYSKRHKTPLSLVIFDLDFFKRVNDTYGHIAGDQVLRDIAALVQGIMRAEDLLARYGGEEFVIVLRGTSLEEGGKFAERMRSAVERAVFSSGDQRLPVTVSVGVALFDAVNMNEPVALIEAADKMLYAAKNAGRNRVMLDYGGVAYQAPPASTSTPA